ncbi:MAG: DNA recombination protein RmuC [Deltaproteobacteria bacterium]|nr:MAG: DNA recombination protein RmuC [Deltaproteobacteria bacterium]
MDIAVIVLGVVSAGLGAGVVWLGVGRAKLAARAAAAEAERDLLETDLAGERADLTETNSRLVESNRHAGELGRKLGEELAIAKEQLAQGESRRAEFDALEKRFSDAFKALSADALKTTREEFLKQAEPVFTSAHEKQAELIKPIGETLKATREKLDAFEKSRGESFATLMAQVQGVITAGKDLREETAKLSKALSRPEIRGQYGEIQLRRIAELAGMTSYCDFTEQTSQRDEDGNLLRPDMVVSLPNKRTIAIDAKTNTYAYLEAVNAKDDEEREIHLEKFARHVSEQVKKLSDKKYWSLFEGGADFVVMFIPGDHFIDAALERRPDLIETAAQQNVILASPSTLIGLLRAVHVGWREYTLAEEAKELFELGKELHDRAAVAFEHAGKLGDSIRQSVERYNKLVGSIDTRMMPTLKRFEDAGAKSGKTLTEMKPVDATPRLLESGE